jgi:hypothetical protein
MAFTAAFIAHAPDADPDKHKSVIDTGKYKLFTVVVRTEEQALEVSRRLVAEEGVHSILLCPGHSHADVAAIQAAVGANVSVSVARGDPAGTRIAMEVMGREGWFR